MGWQEYFGNAHCQYFCSNYIWVDFENIARDNLDSHRFQYAQLYFEMNGSFMALC